MAFYFFCLALVGISATLTAAQNCGRQAIAPNLSNGGRRSIRAEPPPKATIMGGQQARPHSWPWQAYMLACTSPDSGCRFCGGSLIAEDKVLTAAHCVNRQDTGAVAASAIKIRLGSHNTRSAVGTEEGDIQVGVKSVTTHSQWSYNGFQNDIAILTLDRKVPYSNTISPVCLASRDPSAGTVCYATGWGYTENGWKDELYQGAISVSTDDDCRKEVNGPIDGKICFDVKQKRDTCSGDSGGPVVCKGENGVWNVVGITSYGNSECGTNGRPGIYTKVSYYQRWINSNTNLNSNSNSNSNNWNPNWNSNGNRHGRRWYHG